MCISLHLHAPLQNTQTHTPRKREAENRVGVESLRSSSPPARPGILGKPPRFDQRGASALLVHRMNDHDHTDTAPPLYQRRTFTTARVHHTPARWRPDLLSDTSFDEPKDEPPRPSMLILHNKVFLGGSKRRCRLRESGLGLRLPPFQPALRSGTENNPSEG